MNSTVEQNIAASYETSSLVWARLKYCPYWPARIVKPPPELGKTPRRKLCVFFFGSNNFGFVDVANVQGYQQLRSKFVGRGKGAAFREAVTKADEFLADPITFQSNAAVKPKNKRIVVKKEYDYFVKEEPANDQMFVSQTIDVCPSSTQLLQRKLNDKSIEVERLKSQLESTKENYRVELSELKNNLKNVSRENRSLRACINQLQTGLRFSKETTEKRSENKKVILGAQNRIANNESSSKDVYEVEKIISHQTRGGKQLFLIRWKGFEPSHDTWEREENLSCPKKLREYFSQL